MRGCRFQCLLALLAVLVLSSGMAAGLKGSSKGRKKGRKASERGAFVLERLSQTYLPSYYSAGEPKFCLGSGAAEQVAYDGKEKVIYVVGYKIIHVLDIEYPEAPIVIGHVELHHDVTDVTACGKLVAVSEAGGRVVDPGFVHIFSTFTQKSKKVVTMKRLHKVKVGSLPDMIKFSSDCQKILVANEGEPGKDHNGNFVDPQGSISVIDVNALDEEDTEAVVTIDFRVFNQDAEMLVSKGVRWVFQDRPESHASSFSQDLEPEYVALSKDGKTAYVALQENNAIAVVDLESQEAVSIIPLGLKNFKKLRSKLDGSDKDGGPNMGSWPVYATYQPDALVSFYHGGENYIVTANEGETKVFDGKQGVSYYTDVTSGAGVAHEMSESTDEYLKDALRDDSLLGRLAVSKIDGWSEDTEDGKRVRDRVVLIGGRSFTIFRARDMQPVFDSGDDLGSLSADLFPWAFNSLNPERFCIDPQYKQNVNVDARNYFEWLTLPGRAKSFKPSREPFMSSSTLADKISEAKKDLEEYNSTENPDDHGLHRPSSALTSTPADLADLTSRHSGASPETLVVGIVNRRRLLFVSTEKGGVIFVYDITKPKAPVWQSAIYPGHHKSTWAELYNEKNINDIDSEGMEFVPASQSPSGDPLLIVSGSLSGTVSIYQITQHPSKAQPELVLQSPKARYKKPSGSQIPSRDSTTTLAVNEDLI